ncbi:hypothetical protein AOL_s00110g96 [Orbilia oligospora ATCC 24927]|uniref:Uncharacterized protein n=1 Tax=Arthrobotrys oligospora (strain ATCC 24927 / CBS 115.81 / DSM 1491) TaxID=756982 RepID=G1XKS6_ARTOA|nr:hypothetical protein AOL_s00110g96 [Orbilia oligospora ATCC 24927]EGX46272.1 hypothetical protein AOL_s00110g96 [Orbilia oligospora ATCC 24927]
MDTLDEFKPYIAGRYDTTADLFAMAGARKVFGPKTTSLCIAICQARSIGLTSSDAAMAPPSMRYDADPGAGAYSATDAWAAGPESPTSPSCSIPSSPPTSDSEEDLSDAPSLPLAKARTLKSASLDSSNSTAYTNVLTASLGSRPAAWDDEIARFIMTHLPSHSIELTGTNSPRSAFAKGDVDKLFFPLPDNGYGVFDLYPAVTADLPTVISEYRKYYTTGTAPGITCDADNLRIAFAMMGAEPGSVFGRLCGTPYVTKGIVEKAHSTLWPRRTRESMNGHPKLLPLAAKLKLFADACSISITEAVIKNLEPLTGCFNLWCCPGVGRDCCQAHTDLSVCMVYADTAYPTDHGPGWQSAVISQACSVSMLRGLATTQCADSLLGNAIAGAAVARDPFCSYRQSTSETFKSLTSRHASAPVGEAPALTADEWTGYHIARYIDSGLTSLTAHGTRLAYEHLPGRFTDSNCRSTRIGTLFHDLWDVPFDCVGTGSPNSAIAFVVSGALPSYTALYRRLMGDMLSCAELCLETGHYRPLIHAIGTMLFSEATVRYANLLQDSSTWRPIPHPRVFVISPENAYWDLAVGTGRALDMTSTLTKVLDRFGMTWPEGADYLNTAPRERSSVAMRAFYAAWKSTTSACKDEDLLEPMRHLLAYLVHWRDLPLGMYAQYLDGLFGLVGKEEDVVMNIAG